MMNQILFVTSQEAQKIKDAALPGKNCLVVEIDGEKYPTYNDYIRYIEKLLDFPRPCDGIWERYDDWMTDLSWLNYTEYVFIVRNYNDFLSKDTYGKQCFYECFEELILPWWESEVVDHMVDGKPMKMNVYLVHQLYTYELTAKAGIYTERQTEKQSCLYMTETL